MKLAKLEGGILSVSATAATIIAAVVAALPPLVNAVADRLRPTQAQTSTLTLERAKMDIERRKAAAALFQAVLANPDSTQRRLLVEFLATAEALDATSAVPGLPSEKLPYWPAWATKTP